MASTTLTSRGQRLKLLYYDNIHINSYVFRVADHEIELRIQIYLIRDYIWPL